MPSLRELKKHLRSIEMTGQLAGAMKTVSAAKYSRMNNVLQTYARYAELCADMRERFGAALAEAYPCTAPDAPRCYVVLGANRGLCGGYNIELLNYADEVLAASDRPWRLIVTGKVAIGHFRDAGVPIEREFVLPDVVQYSDCASLLACLLELYGTGEISSVEIIGQKFVNMLTQTPTRTQLLPLTDCAGSDAAQDILYVPDRGTVLRTVAATCVSAAIYTHLLEAAAGAQAATLMAMRSAFDNAEKSSAELESAISRKRQSEVTASVIETAGGYFEH